MELEFDEIKPGNWDYDTIISILKNKSLLSDTLKAAYINKSRVVNKTPVYLKNEYNNKYVAYLLESEAGKKSYFNAYYINFVNNFKGAKWYLLSSEDQEKSHGDGGVLLAKFGNRIIMVAPLTYSQMKLITSFENLEQLKRFDTLINNITDYCDEFYLDEVEVVNDIKKAMEAK